MADPDQVTLDLTAPSQQDAQDLIVAFLGGQTDAMQVLLERSDAPVGLLVATAYGLAGSVDMAFSGSAKQRRFLRDLRKESRRVDQ